MLETACHAYSDDVQCTARITLAAILPRKWCPESAHALQAKNFSEYSKVHQAVVVVGNVGGSGTAHASQQCRNRVICYCLVFGGQMAFYNDDTVPAAMVVITLATQRQLDILGRRMLRINLA